MKERMNGKTEDKKRKSRSAFEYAIRTAVIYFALGVIWIFISDEFMMAVIPEKSSFVTVSIIKGWSYVFTTAILCFFMIYGSFKRILEYGRELSSVNDELKAANAVMSAVIESAQEIDIYALDTEYRYLAFNNNHRHRVKEACGYDIRTGDMFFENKCNDINVLDTKERFDKALKGRCIVTEESAGGTKETQYFFRNYYSPIRSGDEIIGLTCFKIDITPQKKAEDRSIYVANHDERTGLYNREYFEKQLKHIDTKDNLPISVIVGDFNGLKHVNDTFGHQFGDRILKISADAIRKICRTGDIVARWGGDEFLILMPKTGIIEAGNIVRKIKDECGSIKMDSIHIDFTFGWDTKESADTDISHVIKNAEDFMYRYKIVDSRSMRNESIKTIMNTLHEKNPREAAHSNRVGQICRMLGEAAGLSSIDLNTINTIGFLHDIGKVAIEENVLNKEDKLSDKEFQLIRKHPEIGYRILMSSYGIPDIAEAVLFHHERWDGKGYPRGISGENIPLISRIVAIADSYDAMTSERPYKKRLSSSQAAEEILRNAGFQFDPVLAKVFVEKVIDIMLS
jgi:diguanylate cyclase (GGDEF)-like protein